jgi:hypothetical protein
MKTNPILERLKAWDQGEPVPTGSTLPWPRAEDQDRLVLAFVRMGGESSPWGVAVGSPGGNPAIFSVPEPRNPDQHAAFVRRFARELLDHLHHPTSCSPFDRASYLADRSTLAAIVRKRQLWTPGPTHLAMLHFLDFRYTLATTGSDDLLREVRALGRAAGWLFRESTRPGQVRVHDATARLRQAFTFPAEPPRQAHLGFLLAWLSAPGTREDRSLAARQAESESISVSLDPDYEREHLVPLVTQWNAARSSPEEATELAGKIHEKLAPELERRWRLTVKAMRLFDDDPRPDNPQLSPIIDLGADDFFFQYWQKEARGLDQTLPAEERKYLVSHPETDFIPATAARRYFTHLHAFELAAENLIHGDDTLVEQAIDAGKGFRGRIHQVLKDGANKASATLWVVQTPTDDSLRLREESSVCQIGARKRIGRIRSIKTDGKTRSIVMEIIAGKTRKAEPGQPDCDDAKALEGREVIFVDDAGAGLSSKKASKVTDADGPGAWLTHAAPLPEPSPLVRVRSDLVDLVKSLH